MKTWILSPNVHNDATENAWKNSINDLHKAFIGYNTDHRFGQIFSQDIKIGDIILIAQGMNANKRVFLCGEVASSAVWGNLNRTPGFAQNRQLIHVITQEELIELNLDFNDSKWGDSKQPATLYDLEPKNNLKDRIIHNLLVNRILQKKNDMKIESIIDLLNYKKQIILQGPPGSGKTKLAKEIATKMLTKKITKIPLEELKLFLSNHQVSEEVTNWRKTRGNAMEQFQISFPKANLLELTLDSYCIGKSNKDNFCWWIERGLESYGRYTPGFSINYGVYYSKTEQQYKTLKRYETPEAAVDEMKIFVSHVANEEFDAEGFKKLGDGFILKILASYYPEKYVQVYKPELLVTIANLLEIDSKLHYIELNKSINQKLIQLIQETASNCDTREVIHYFFRTFIGGNESEYKAEEQTITSRPTIVQFHPSFSYEDFVRGILAEDQNGDIKYTVQNKVLADLAKKAIDDKENPYVLIIDEINRANLSSVLGELIYALEYRDEPVNSMYALENSNVNEYELILPSNLYIIGTMNTADRSVSQIDYAIRRRFAFVSIPSKNLAEEGLPNFDSDLFEKVAALFENNCSSEFNKEDVQLGHSYFIDKKDDIENPVSMDIRWEYEIKPILLEYVKDGILIGNVGDKSIKEYIEANLSS